MTGKETFMRCVDEGRRGCNIGLHLGSEKLMTYVDGYLPGTSYLIGGASGSGKSTFALWTFVYNPLKDFLEGNMPERDPHWVLFNLEMTQPQIYAKLVSMHVFDTFGKQLTFKRIFSRGKDTMLGDDDYAVIKECGRFLDILDERLSCHDGFLDEATYMNVMDMELKRFGTYADDGSYVPANRHQVLGVMIDHCSLVRAHGRSKKDEMDAISRDSVALRNRTGIVSPIHISQMNRSGNSDVRLQQGMREPLDSDFKDSGSLYEDSQVVMSLFSPYKNRMARYGQYNISVLEDTFVSIGVLKTRFGSSSISIPMGFYGDCGHYRDLPKAEVMGDQAVYRTPEWNCEEKNERDRTKKNEFTF